MQVSTVCNLFDYLASQSFASIDNIIQYIQPEDISNQVEEANAMFYNSKSISMDTKQRVLLVTSASITAAIERLLLSSFAAGSNPWNYSNSWHTHSGS